jgi:hypothetical protein
MNEQTMAGAAAAQRQPAEHAVRKAVRVADVPNATTVFGHISDAIDFEAACAGVTPRIPVTAPMRLAIPAAMLRSIRSAAREAITRYGLHSWLSREGRPERSTYESLSLTFNPALRDPEIHDIHQSTLGTSINPLRDQYYGTVHRFPELKNTYFDTYGFRHRTPASLVGALGKFLSECRLSLVRSRLSVLSGQRVEADYSWHRDEPLFENLRVLIPLVSHPNYRLEIEHERDFPAAESTTTSLHYLKSGYAYAFDTHRPHRVLAVAPCRVMRVHLVLGFSPWLDYVPEDDAWVPNAYYGRVHPFDILRAGGLHPALRLVD